MQKDGDPGGFCAAWSYYYIEQRLNNPELLPKKIKQKLEVSLKKEMEELGYL